MLNPTNRSLLQKGIFAVASVALVGTSGVVAFAANQTGDHATTSGYGTNSDAALAAVDAFNQKYVTYSDDFVGQVQGLVDTARGQLSPQGTQGTEAFAGEFDTATNAYYDQVQAAQDAFRTAVQQAMAGASSKDQFIDSYNHAKADYLNALDAAKNRLADRLSQLGNGDNMAKDQFMNGFNSARDAYSNRLEQAKNDFAATLG